MDYKRICYTSFSYSYLPKAILLARTFKKYNPGWKVVAFVTDKEPEGFDNSLILKEFDVVINTDEIGIPNYQSWLFRHSIVEACTAVKGHAMKYLLDRYSPQKIMYLDPDIAVFNEFSMVDQLLDDYDILLTPHQVAFTDDDSAIRDNEIGSLKHGVFNLGFVAVTGRYEGLKFANWWADRLYDFCYDDIPNGLFTDQKWCNLVPAFFDNVKIIRDFGHNVASWNIYNRDIHFLKDGSLVVNGRPLIFYHFTKLGPVGEVMTAKYAKTNYEVYELWAWYKRKVKELSQNNIPDGWWFYNNFQNGEKILPEMRCLFKSRQDLQKQFPNPFQSNGFLNWYVDDVRSVN
ncbi:MAG: hypothetical protein K9G67_12420 [Bacteroidales bacterium]|nr:hypothetical protein [Bacteroidales bacterium]MCF8350613.1 hypothetical protein [Bacteroidales bacterium]MCF8377154.1 hypothetical protein [Bacteroidales bacterium]